MVNTASNDAHKYECRQCHATVLIANRNVCPIEGLCARCGQRECPYCSRPLHNSEEFPTCHREECWHAFVVEHDTALRKFGSLPKYEQVAQLNQRRDARWQQTR